MKPSRPRRFSSSRNAKTRSAPYSPSPILAKDWKRLSNMHASTPENRLLALHHYAPNEGQLAIGMGDVHAITHDKDIGTAKSDKIGGDLNGALTWLLQHRTDQHPPRAARRDQIFGESEGATRFQDVVDQQHVAIAHRGFDVLEDAHRSRRDGALQITRQMDELDMRLEPDPMQGADQVGGEHERALQHGDNQQVLWLDRGDFLGQLLVALGDGGFVVQDFDLPGAAHEPFPPGETFAPAAANFTRTSPMPSGGASSLVRNATFSLASSRALGAGAVHT